MEALAPEYMELLQMHVFDYEDLQSRMIKASTMQQEQQIGKAKIKYKFFKE